MTAWPFADLQPGAYGAILADPPWRFQLYGPGYEARAPQAHYACMATDAIAALPVAQLAARDCLLFLWATFPMLPQALQVMQAWGFAYRAGGAWLKRTPGGHPAFGTGFILRSATEPYLIGVRGRPQLHRANASRIRNLIDAPAREHSRKPEEAHRVVEALRPHVRRCELFAREARPGWDVWGNETGKFANAVRTDGAGGRP